MYFIRILGLIATKIATGSVIVKKTMLPILPDLARAVPKLTEVSLKVMTSPLIVEISNTRCVNVTSDIREDLRSSTCLLRVYLLS